MAINLLNDVPEEKRFWLADGRLVSSIKDLHNILKSLNKETFDYHVNESKNDFYNWVKDVYGDRQLADDLLECSTKEGIIFCLISRLNQEENVSVLNELPKESLMENIGEARLILNELPKKNVLERVEPKPRKQLITLLDKSLFKKEVKKVPSKAKTKNKAITKPKTDNEKFNKEQIKKFKAESPKDMIKRLKEVYDID